MTFRLRCSLVILFMLGSLSSHASAQTRAQSSGSSTRAAAAVPAPLLAYLRCEDVPLDQFGAAQKPVEDLVVLMRRVNPKANDLNDTPLHLEIWPGIRAEVHAVAGYGHFGLLQFYPLEQKEALLKVLAAAGWEMKREPAPAELVRSRTDALIPVYEATKPMGTLIRRMKLMGVRMDPFSEKIDLNGLTLVCSYGKGTAAR